MPRQIRIEFPGAWYHVMNRGINRKTIFHTNEYYKLFFDIISKAHLKYPFEIHAYCFMSNHYHLLIRTPEPNLGKIMRKINGTFAQKYNFLQKNDGPLFKGRYKAILVDTDEYFLELNRYIHLNPIRAKIVENPADYYWSSYKYYLNTKLKPAWLHCDKMMSHFNHKVNSFKTFIAEGNNEDASNSIKSFFKKKSIIPILGSDNFIKSVTNTLSERVSNIILDNSNHLKNLTKLNIRKTLNVLQNHLSHYSKKIVVENIIRIVSKSIDVENSIVPFGLHNNVIFSRKVAIYLTYKMTNLTQKQIGKKFDDISRSQVFHICYNMEKMLKENSDFTTIMNKIINDITIINN